MEIIIADHAGFCFGVKRALQLTEKCSKEDGRTDTYGPLIHNPQVVKSLESKGISSNEEYKRNPPKNMVIRSHGVPSKVKEDMKSEGIQVVDGTCPVLLNIYRKIQKKQQEGYQIIIIGDPKHAEIIGLNGHIDNKGWIIDTVEKAKCLKNLNNLYIISQTTNTFEKFFEISDIIEKYNTNVLIDNTICNATRLRQEACKRLSKEVDAMIVIGGYNSSNTNKLSKVASEYCKHVLRIETANDLSRQEVLKYKKIGITAGASTPVWIIEEVVKRMDNYSKDEFMEQVEGSITKIYPKDIVKGTIIYVTDSEVMVNIGYRSDGIIKLDELSTDETKKPKDLFQEGQEIDVFVIKLDDGEGNVVLSTRRVEGLKNWEALMSKYENKEAVEAKVTKEVKGGLLATVQGIHAFIPGSQITTHFVKDLKQYIGQTIPCEIISVDEKKRRIVVSGRVIKEREEKEKLDKAWENIEVDKVMNGTVARLTDFGAFVNLGGVDGLIHVSDIAWRRIKHPSEVLSVGDEVEVKVLRANREKNRISLGLKQLTKRPFENFLENNKVDDVVKGTVVNLLDFGAFVRLEEGVEGLVHVSQISYEHVEKPSDELTVGDEIEVKILEINEEEQRIALSIKETKPAPKRPERKPAERKARPKKERKFEQNYENQELDNSLASLLDELDITDK